MGLSRFQQIKRYIHVSPYDASDEHYYSKVEPLMFHIRDTSKKLYLLKSNVAIDEMMVQFSGRSVQTVKIKNKPIPQGYKILSLGDEGYDTYTWESLIVVNEMYLRCERGTIVTRTHWRYACLLLMRYTFVPTSRKINKTNNAEESEGVSYTGRLVIGFVKQLPYQDRAFNLYVNNYSIQM